MKNCANCQVEFQETHGKQKFCSNKCKMANSRNKKEVSDSISEPPSIKATLSKGIVSESEQPIKERIKTMRNSVVEKKVVFNETNPNQKLGKLQAVMDGINKDFGAGTVMRFGDSPTTEYKVISTGSVSLDVALGIGGLPRGRIVEIFGMESSGKTTLALNVIADAQRQGLKCLLVDAENAFDPEYAHILGVNIDELQYCQPSCGEQGLEVADRQILSGEIGVVVIDSVAALVPKKELEGEMGDAAMGLHARLMSQACRKMVSSVAKTNTLCIFINQIRNKIGVMFGSPEVTTGGMALQFYSSVRLQVSRSTTAANSVMDGDLKTGNLTTVKVIKNKCSAPFRQAQFNIIYGVGIDTISEMVDLGISLKIIEKTGGWFSYNEHKVQGKDSLIDLLTAHEVIANEIKAKIYETLKKKK